MNKEAAEALRDQFPGCNLEVKQNDLPSIGWEVLCHCTDGDTRPARSQEAIVYLINSGLLRNSGKVGKPR